MTAIATDATNTTVLDAVRKLRPLITARSEEIERAGTLPQDLIDALVGAGVWRMYVPKAFGGEEMTFPEVFDVLVELARADSSVGWVLMIGFMGATFPTQYPEDMARKLYANAPTMKVRGVFAPTGVATPAGGGYIVTGQWAFASGTADADWVAATCVVMKDGELQTGPDGIPTIVMAMVPAQQATFLDNWKVAGMRGTASQDFVLDEVFVPEQFAVAATDRASAPFSVPSSRLPFWVSVAPGHAAVAIGIAKGALDDLLSIVSDKRPTYNLPAPSWQNRGSA